jgi:hypothetical protein
LRKDGGGALNRAGDFLHCLADETGVNLGNVSQCSDSLPVLRDSWSVFRETLISGVCGDSKKPGFPLAPFFL